MPNRVKVKRTYVAGVTPAAAELEPHEFAVNWADGVVFVKTQDGTIQSLTLGGGGGSGSGGSANIVEVAVAGSLPAVGASNTIYIITDFGRVLRWDAANSVYVEIGN